MAELVLMNDKDRSFHTHKDTCYMHTHTYTHTHTTQTHAQNTEHTHTCTHTYICDHTWTLDMPTYMHAQIHTIIELYICTYT